MLQARKCPLGAKALSWSRPGMIPTRLDDLSDLTRSVGQTDDVMWMRGLYNIIQPYIYIYIHIIYYIYIICYIIYITIYIYIHIPQKLPRISTCKVQSILMFTDPASRSPSRWRTRPRLFCGNCTTCLPDAPWKDRASPGVTTGTKQKSQHCRSRGVCVPLHHGQWNLGSRCSSWMFWDAACCIMPQTMHDIHLSWNP